MRLRDQAAALALLRTDPALDGLTTLTAPLVDREVHKLAWPSLLLFTDQQCSRCLTFTYPLLWMLLLRLACLVPCTSTTATLFLPRRLHAHALHAPFDTHQVTLPAVTLTCIATTNATARNHIPLPGAWRAWSLLLWVCVVE